jgi:hypothetical protein
MKSIQVIKEFCQLAGSMWPDDEYVIHVAKSAEGLIGRRLQSHFFKIFHELVCNDNHFTPQYNPEDSSEQIYMVSMTTLQ